MEYLTRCLHRHQAIGIRAGHRADHKAGNIGSHGNLNSTPNEPTLVWGPQMVIQLLATQVLKSLALRIAVWRVARCNRRPPANIPTPQDDVECGVVWLCFIPLPAMTAIVGSDQSDPASRLPRKRGSLDAT